ncbi:LPXTG cell wall anchor domain-containing protein [Streptomyces sp. NPDC014776]
MTQTGKQKRLTWLILAGLALGVIGVVLYVIDKWVIS